MNISIKFRGLALRGLLAVGLFGAVQSSRSWVYVPFPPTVTISATDTNASEVGPDTGTFTVTRTGEDLSLPLVVYFETPTGSADSGTDYETLPEWVTIQAYDSTTNVTLTPILDSNCGEGDQTVVLALAENESYWVGWPSDATVTIGDTLSPSITTTLTNQITCPGASVTFQIAATGTGLDYAWKHDGVTIPCQTNSSLTLTNVGLTDAGSYAVTVTNSCSSVVSNATLMVLTNVTVSEPTNQTVCPGSTATFTVTASGSGPIGYQWKFGTNVLAGKTNSSLTLTNVGSTDAGSYAVTVTNSCSSVVSNATLTVLTNGSGVPGSGMWIVNTNGNWSTTGNWLCGTVADGTNATADFSAISITADRTITLDGARNIGIVKFGDTSSPYQDWTLSGASTLTLVVSSGSPTITVNNSAQSTISCVIGGTQGLTKNGATILKLTGTNTYAGDTSVSGGTLKYGADNCIPNGAGKGNVIVNSGATLDMNGGFNVGINGLSGAGMVINTGGSGTSTLTVGNNDVSSTFSGSISNATSGTTVQALTKTGTGTLTLSGTNKYTGATTVSAGALLMNSPGSLAAGSAVSVSSGAALGGTGTIRETLI